MERERDTVTKWIHRNWLEPFCTSNDVIIAMVIARLVNFPETLAELGFPEGGWSTQYYRHFLDTFARRREAGFKSWTSAYMITGGYSAGGDTKEVIIGRVISYADSNLHKDCIRNGDTLAAAAYKLTSPGIGPFLSAQIIADLKYSPLLNRARDWQTWCAPGPGSTMGLNFLHDREPAKVISGPHFIEEVGEVRKILENAGVHLDAQNTQNCLCEFSKYVRAKYFGKRLKSRYIPS